MPYSTPADVTNILNITFTTSSVPTQLQVTDLILRADSYVDKATGHNWYQNNVQERYDAIGTGPRAGKIILRNAPLLSVTSVEYWDPGTQTWIAGIEGYPTQFPSNQTFYVYYPEGKIQWHKLRLDDSLRYRVTYTWGYATVPDAIRDLSSSIAARDVLTFWGSQLSIQEDQGLMKTKLDQRITRLIARFQSLPAAVG